MAIAGLLFPVEASVILLLVSLRRMTVPDAVVAFRCLCQFYGYNSTGYNSMGYNIISEHTVGLFLR